MSAVPVIPAATKATAPDTATSSDADIHAAHSAHSAHSDTLRLRAVSLWCEGLRSPAIAKQLGIPERTIRAWLAEGRADFQAEQGETAQDIIALAVERQLAISAAAWQSYHHAVMLEELAMDYHRAQAQQAHDEAHELPSPPPRPSTAPARYLSVAMAAQREAARLSGCYDLAKAAAKLAAAKLAAAKLAAAKLAAPQLAAPQPRPLTYADTPGLDPADERAWDVFLRHLGLSPARFAGPADLDELCRPAWEAFRRRLRARSASPTPFPAESATAPTEDRVELEPKIPAETATASIGLGSAAPSTTRASEGLAAELQPAESSAVQIPRALHNQESRIG